MYPVIKPRDGWILIGQGRHRMCYLLPSGYVLKAPFSESGEKANRLEAEMWRNRHDSGSLPRWARDWKFARCRLIPGTDLLVMEFVWPTFSAWFGGSSQKTKGVEKHFPEWSRRFFPVGLDDLPYWARIEIDCEQVGFNRKGELVAYDYAE